MAIGDLKVFDIIYDGLVLQVTAIDLGGGQTGFSVKCISGFADINAVYWGDDVADGSSVDLGGKKDNSLNMNGTGADFDGGYKVSSTGLGKEGTDKPSYLTAGEDLYFTSTVDWADVDTLGVRATSTSTAEGSIKGVDGGATEILAPKVCVADAAPVIEGTSASFEITLDHVYAYDVTINYETVSGTADGSDYTHTAGSVTILAGDLSATVTVATTDDTTVETPENFTLHLTGATADIPGNDIAVTVLCADGEGTILDNDVETPPGGGNPPAAEPTALSHGYWKEHGFTDSEGFVAGVGSDTFDAFFTLDNPDPHAWTDKVGPNTVSFAADLTFAQAVTFSNGNGTGDFIDPGVDGDEADLVREAATAVLNFYDADNTDSFQEWYIYLRNENDNDNVANDFTDADAVLADLRAQVDATLSGDAGAYTVDELAALLHGTHH